MKNYFDLFDFVSDEELRKELILDYKEVLVCVKRKASKGAVVIAGGIVEAILKNRALQLLPEEKQRVKKIYLELTQSNKEIEKMDFFYLIKTLESLSIITTPQASRSDMLRDYRNLIHPFKDRRRPTLDDARSVKKILDDLLDEFGRTVGPKTIKTDRAQQFLFHSKWKNKREKIEYREILNCLYDRVDGAKYDDLLSLPAFKSKANPSKSLIANLIYLRDQALCDYDLESWQGYPINRYERWVLNSAIRDEVGRYINGR